MSTGGREAGPVELRLPDDAGVVVVEPGDRMIFVVDEGTPVEAALELREQINEAMVGESRSMILAVRGVVVLRGENAATDDASRLRARTRGNDDWTETTCLLHGLTNCLECTS